MTTSACSDARVDDLGVGAVQDLSAYEQPDLSLPDEDAAAPDDIGFTPDGGIASTIPATFFGMHAESATWPLAITIGSRRLWDAQTAWSQIETSAGSYDFTTLGGRIAQATAAHADVYYTQKPSPFGSFHISK